MRFLIVLILFICLSVGATTFTEFFVQSTGGNTNSGHTTDDTATFSAVSGNWTNSTLKYFKSGLDPVAGGVTNGAWAAIFLTAFPTNAQYDAIVTAADDTADTITLSSAAFMGTNPGNNVGGMSIRVGGAWKGPNTNTMANGGGFPFNFAGVATATNAANVFQRVNVKTNTYTVASAITHALNGPGRFQGYAVSPGDGGKPTIAGPATGTSFVILTVTGANLDFADLIFDQNGNAGSAAGGITVSGGECYFFRIVVSRMIRSGFNMSGTGLIMEECEAFGNNVANASAQAGILGSANRATYLRCISHDNAGGNTSGFLMADGTAIWCVADTNGKDGFTLNGTTVGNLINCDSYKNSMNGLDFTTASGMSVIIENCNFFKNTLKGVTSSGSALRNGALINCAFGSGTQTNSDGNISSSIGGIVEMGTILYAADLTPWRDPENGDFRIASGVAGKASGRGSFTQTAASYAGTVGYPDIGAAQSESTNAQKSFTFSQ